MMHTLMIHTLMTLNDRLLLHTYINVRRHIIQIHALMIHTLTIHTLTIHTLTIHTLMIHTLMILIESLLLQRYISVYLTQTYNIISVCIDMIYRYTP